MLPQPLPRTALPYQPELMGLRAVAASMVILGHWLQLSFPLDEVGLLPLYAVSGYLISGIIWQNNLYWGAPGRWWQRLGYFYARRFLRTVPPYYVALALGALLPLATLRQHPAWFLLFSSNILCYKLQQWPEGVGHYWSVAVEEQFYLLWPLLLGLLHRRERWLWLLIMVSFSYRAYGAFYATPAAPVFATVLLPSCFDLFAAGALLRLHTHNAAASCPAKLRRSGELALTAWASWWGIWWLTRPCEQVWVIIYPGLGALASYFTLKWLLQSPPQAYWLTRPWAQWLGQRSYGLYLYHLMLPVFYQRLLYHLLPASSPWRQWWLQPLPTLVVLTPLLLLLCTASWRWLEAPLTKLKTRFSYRIPPSVPLATHS
jgi:peptidoglycan/LPS O-acetylase OafA/YrhL